MNETKIDNFPLGKIRPGATNPRKHFNEAEIVEMSDSIVAAKGIIQPLVVRPDWCIGKTAEQIAQVNGSAPTPDFFEIVDGERRYRGAVRVKLEEVPTIVRFLSDKETLEIQLISNLQRSDLTPIEEARAYRRLIDEMGHTVESIHEKTGKDRKTIYGKLKMLNAPASMLAAIDQGVVAQQMGELVGSIPLPSMRERAASEILKPTDPMYGVGPMNREQAEEFVRDNFRRPLSGAPFDQADATLVEIITEEKTGERLGGGACTDCPLRSGNRPELAGAGLKRTDMCLNPKCFAMKSDVHFGRIYASAAAEGKRVLAEDECALIFNDNGSLRFDSDYVLLSGQPDRQEIRSDYSGKLPSWKKLIEGLPAEQSVEVPSEDQKTKVVTMVKRTEPFKKPEIAIGRDPKGRVVELVDRRLAIESVNLAATQKGEKSIFDKTSKKAGSTSASSSSASSAGTAANSEEEPEWKKQDRRNKEIAKLNFQITLASMGALIAAIDDKGPVKGFWDALIEASITHAGHDGCWLICKRLGLDPKAENGHTNIEGVQGAALEYGLTLPDEKLKIGYVAELLLSQRVKFSQQLGGLKNTKSFNDFAELYKVDLEAIEKRVTAEAKEAGKKTGKRKPETGKTKPPAKAAKQATPKATLVNPTAQQLENAFSGVEITRGTIRQPVVIEGKEYTVSSITYPPKGPTVFNLVELIAATDFKGGTRDEKGENAKKGPRGYYHGVKINHHGKAYVLGYSRDYSFGKKKPERSKRTVARVVKPKKDKHAKNREKLNKAMKARWAARRKAASKKGGAKK